jgi:hypothetical protein
VFKRRGDVGSDAPHWRREQPSSTVGLCDDDDDDVCMMCDIDRVVLKIFSPTIKRAMTMCVDDVTPFRLK